MRRRDFIALLAGAAAAAWPLSMHAQQVNQVPRIGVLGLRSFEPKPTITAFAQGLRDLGYIEGYNIIVEYRSANDSTDRLPGLAAELVALGVQVIVAPGSQAVRAAQQATHSIPIVMAASSDPVGSGFVDGLARPGKNITGLSLQSPEASGKRLELISELVPGIARVAVLWNPDNPPAESSLEESRIAAAALGLQLLIFETRQPGDFDRAFQAAAEAGAGAVLLVSAPNIISQGRRIAELAVQTRLVTISPYKEFPDDGGLMSYGPNLKSLYRRAAYFVDRILKGAKPTDLPVEQPTKFELVVNLKAANAIALAIPPMLLARADEVLE